MGVVLLAGDARSAAAPHGTLAVGWLPAHVIAHWLGRCAAGAPCHASCPPHAAAAGPEAPP